MNTVFLDTSKKLFRYYKGLAEKAIAQTPEKDLFILPQENENSIAIIVQHLAGNMLSRWTDFLTTDGEKPWRNRDQEFEVQFTDKEALMNYWEKGWKVFLDTLDNLTEDDLGKTIHIRQDPQLVIEAIQRQLAHYPYHVGQIVYLCKFFTNEAFESLSIPKGKSEAFNQQSGEKRPWQKK
ncbi:MAG: DUF1572 domain-containing protein [Chitinophagales bacterium]|nr:DUF1572 domain-containing protein [Chitinophagales bacterium]